MKKIVAMVSEDALEGVVALLVEQGVDGMTVMKAASDRSGGATRSGRVRVEIVVESHRADRVIESVEAILDSTPALEPGALTIEEVETVVHIRSGQVLT